MTVDNIMASATDPCEARVNGEVFRGIPSALYASGFCHQERFWRKRPLSVAAALKTARPVATLRYWRLPHSQWVIDMDGMYFDPAYVSAVPWEEVRISKTEHGAAAFLFWRGGLVAIVAALAGEQRSGEIHNGGAGEGAISPAEPRLKPGDVFSPRHPFVCEKHWDDDNVLHVRWRPGVSIEDEHTPQFTCYCDGEGQQVLTVVSVHKPGAFRERVFYTRQWIDPTGALVGKPKLFVKATGAFRQLAKGYRYSYDVDGENP